MQKFATDSAARDAALASAWTYLVSADRFTGPATNPCTSFHASRATALRTDRHARGSKASEGVVAGEETSALLPKTFLSRFRRSLALGRRH